MEEKIIVSQIDGYLTVAGAATRLGVTDKRIIQLMGENRLETIWIDHRTPLVSIESVEIYEHTRKR